MNLKVQIKKTNEQRLMDMDSRLLVVNGGGQGEGWGSRVKEIKDAVTERNLTIELYAWSLLDFIN